MRLSRRGFIQSTFGVVLLPWMPGRCAEWLPAAACPSREELLAAIRVYGPCPPLNRLGTIWNLLVYGQIERYDGQVEAIMAAGACPGQPAVDGILRWDMPCNDGEWLYRHSAPRVVAAKERLAEYLEQSCRQGWWDMPLEDCTRNEDGLLCVDNAVRIRQPFRRLHVWSDSRRAQTRIEWMPNSEM